MCLCLCGVMMPVAAIKLDVAVFVAAVEWPVEALWSGDVAGSERVEAAFALVSEGR